MAEAASQIPSFKLVLVGDGGTGKVSHRNPSNRELLRSLLRSVEIRLAFLVLRKQTLQAIANAIFQTTFVKRHLTGEFEKKYIATLGVEVHPLGFTTVRLQPAWVVNMI